MGLVVVGASALGRAVLGIALAEAKSDVIGLVDDKPLALSHIDGVPYLGGTELLRSLFDEMDGIELILAIGDSRIRSQVYQRIADDIPRVRFATLIHPRATLLGNVSIERGSIVFPGAVLGPGSRVGRSVVINANASLGAGVMLDEFVSIGPGVNLGSDVILGKGTYVGMGAAIAQQVRIGEWCTIGALSFIRDDIPSKALAVGIPSRIVEPRA